MINRDHDWGPATLGTIIVVCVLCYLTTFDYQGVNARAVVHVAGWVALCSFCGYWVGLGNSIWRFPVVVAFAAFTAFFSNDFKMNRLDIYLVFSFGLVFNVGVTTYTLRLIFGELSRSDETAKSKDALQFSVRDILIWTTTIAATLAFAKWSIAKQGNTGLDAIIIVCGLMGTLVVTNVVAIWALLGTKLTATRLITFFVVIVIASCLNDLLVAANGFWLIATPVSQIPIIAAIYALRKQDYRFVKSGIVTN